MQKYEFFYLSVAMQPSVPFAAASNAASVNGPFKAHSHSPQKSLVTAVDCIDAEI